MILLTLMLGCNKEPAPVVPEATCVDPQQNGERLLRRLTHAEYARTVRDLVGVAYEAEVRFASDPVVDGYRNDAWALTVNDLLADQYRTAAEQIAEDVDLGTLLPCDPATAGDGACATQFIQDFGLRAFRRPLDATDVDRYAGVWSDVAAVDGFDEGIRWVVAAMLQSPHFLYRSELGIQAGSRFALTDWEMASALSYSLWGTMPDAALFDAAEAGSLTSEDGIASQVERMAADPRADTAVADFVDAWLELGQLATVSREGLTPDLRQTMAAETRGWVTELAKQQATLGDLLGDGLLVQSSLLTTYARPDGSSPVHRGVLVRERMLCEHLPPPPPNLDTSPPEVDPTRSTRDRYVQHSNDPACAGCHSLIDPLGFAFEHYDQLGQWRDDDGGHPINDAGDVDGVTFDGADDLAGVLADDARFRSCFVQAWRRHLLGASVCGEDLGIDVGLTEPRDTMPTAETFRYRSGGAEEGNTLAVGSTGDVDPVDDPVPTGGVTLTVEINNDWGAGYCAEGVVNNPTEAPVVWSGAHPRDGTINNIWNAVYTEDATHWTFSGADFNAEVPPGETVSFGFCADR